MFKVALLLISALALAQQASGTEECDATVIAKIAEITDAKLKTDGAVDEAKLAAECKTVQDLQKYKDAETACSTKLNERTQSLVTKDCPDPAAEPENEPEDGDSGSTMTSLSAAVAMAVVLPLLRQ